MLEEIQDAIDFVTLEAEYRIDYCLEDIADRNYCETSGCREFALIDWQLSKFFQELLLKLEDVKKQLILQNARREESTNQQV